MKSKYATPQIEVIEIEIEDAILNNSGISNPISSDNALDAMLPAEW